MLNYGTPLLLLILASVSYQRVTAFQQKGNCPTIEIRIDDSAQSWQSETFHDFGTTITRLTPRVCGSNTNIGVIPTRSRCSPFGTVCPSREALLALGYELFPDVGFYKMVKDAKNYQSAKQMCETEGAHLVVVNTEAEAIALNTLIDRRAIKGWYWGGFDDHATEGSFRTIFDQSVAEAGFAKLFPGEPNGGRGENCGVYRYDGHNYGLGDGNCAAGYWFICERELQFVSG